MRTKLSIAKMAHEIGLGDPSSRHWFVALEEHGDPSEYEVQTDSKYLKYNNENTNVWNITAKIMVGLVHGEELNMGWRDFRAAKLFTKGLSNDEGNYLVELLPLPLPKHGHWESSYSKLFEEEVDSFDSYRSMVLGPRIQFLRQHWKDHNPAVTICMGHVRAYEFRWLFDLTETPILEGSDQQFQVYRDKKVILTPFFNPRTGMGDSQVVELVRIIRSLKGEEKNA